MDIPILNGIYADQAADFRTSYPRNMVPVPKGQGISKGYLRPADGITLVGTGPGTDRGGFNWNGVCYRVMGTKLVSVSSAGAVTELGDVGSGAQVTIDNGFDRLAIWSGGRLYYWNGSTLTQVIDPDLGTVIDGRWIGGYFMSTDGTSLIVTDLNDPTSVNPLKYGSSEADPDPIVAVDELRNEAYAMNRYSIEVFNNVGGDNFPFQRIDGAQVPRGVIGTHAYCPFVETFAFLGSARNEPPAVWLLGAGTTNKLSTREIETILLGYTEAQLATVVVEARMEKAHELLYIHLPDQCLVYDSTATQAASEPVWFTLDSGVLTPATYRARNLVWCYDKWIVGDPTSTSLGTLTNTISSHYGQSIGWTFGTLVVYNEGEGVIVGELELVGLPGRVAFGADPTIWTSHSLDGQTWSQEIPTKAGKQGQRDKRIAWRRLGKMRNYRMQRFRGNSDAFMSFAALRADLEPLNG
jgi:hypothetical protein